MFHATVKGKKKGGKEEKIEKKRGEA